MEDTAIHKYSESAEAAYLFILLPHVAFNDFTVIYNEDIVSGIIEVKLYNVSLCHYCMNKYTLFEHPLNECE